MSVAANAAGTRSGSGGIKIAISGITPPIEKAIAEAMPA
jgi:hypothetical protein